MKWVVEILIYTCRLKKRIPHQITGGIESRVTLHGQKGHFCGLVNDAICFQHPGQVGKNTRCILIIGTALVLGYAGAMGAVVIVPAHLAETCSEHIQVTG